LAAYPQAIHLDPIFKKAYRKKGIIHERLPRQAYEMEQTIPDGRKKLLMNLFRKEDYFDLDDPLLNRRFS